MKIVSPVRLCGCSNIPQLYISLGFTPFVVHGSVGHCSCSLIRIFCLGILSPGAQASLSAWWTTRGWKSSLNAALIVQLWVSAGTDFDAGLIQSADSQMLSTLEITGMNTTTYQFMVTAHHFDPANSASTTYGYQCTNLTLSLDRIRFSCTTNMTGNWKLYGYRN